MSVFMLSLAGFPLTAGFFGKFFLFAAAIHDGQLPLAIWGILTSAVSLFYYLRVILVMYTRVPAPGAVVDAAGVSVPGAALAGGELAGSGALSRGGLGVVALAAAGTLILGVFPAVIYALLQGVSVVRG
jgi:NADH-quinone oxidoreductase subunit N